MRSDSWCVNPYINLGVVPEGNVVPCCLSRYHYKTDNGNKTVAKESVIEFWNSKDRKDFIRRLEQGERPKECDNCWKEERAGHVSKRMRDNEEYAHVNTDDIELPITMYLGLGNICNLKCRICHEDRSSLFLEEQLKISWFTKTAIGFFHDQKTITETFSKDNQLFWEDLYGLLPNVVKIDFTGGEPLYVKNHWKLLTTAVDKGWSKNLIITYSTNGTIFPEKYLDILNTFKRIDMRISIDGVGDKFNYIRHPGNFVEVDRNIDSFRDAQTASPNVWRLSATTSVSAFNIWDIGETFEYCRSKDLDVFFNFVHDNRSIRFFPKELKEKIIDRLNAHVSQYPKDWNRNKNNIIEYLNSTSYNIIQWKLFWKEVKSRDQFRNESFEKTFPEYYKEVKQYL